MKKRSFAYTVLPILLFFCTTGFFIGVIVANNTYVKTHDLPRISSGVLDLNGHTDFSSFIPLEGEWDFVWDAWPISDNTPSSQLDWRSIQVPGTWGGDEPPGDPAGGPPGDPDVPSGDPSAPPGDPDDPSGDPSAPPGDPSDDPSDGSPIDPSDDPSGTSSIISTAFPRSGHASYRLTIINCPTDLSFRVSALQCDTQYRVFMNGELVFEDGYLSTDPSILEIRSPFTYKDVAWHQGASCELIVETASAYAGGFYMTPVLETSRNAYVGQTASIYQQSFLLGGIIMAVIILALLVAFRDSAFSPKFLILTATILLVLVFLRSDLIDLKAFKLVGAYFERIQILIDLCLTFLPLVSFLSLKALVRIPLGKKVLRVILAGSMILFLYTLTNFIRVGPYSVLVAAIMTSGLLLYLSVELARIWKLQKESLFLACAFFILSLTIGLDAAFHSGLFYFNMMTVLGTGVILFLVMMFALYIKRNVVIQEEALATEHLRFQLKDAQVALMLSQIRPHFTYNALTAIMALIDTDPKLAGHTLGKFSRYLRHNIDTAGSTSLIAFAEELVHIKTYLEIEHLRFGDRVNVVYDTPAMDFKIPALSIQPLVENAVKHGLCKKIEGGTISLSTSEDDEAFTVKIVDDGAGFDASTINDHGGRSVGIDNVSFRLEQEIAATITIESKIDKGTCVVITIPKGMG